MQGRGSGCGEVLLGAGRRYWVQGAFAGCGEAPLGAGSFYWVREGTTGCREALQGAGGRWPLQGSVSPREYARGPPCPHPDAGRQLAVSGVQNTQNFFGPIAGVGIDLGFQCEVRFCQILFLRLILVRRWSLGRAALRVPLNLRLAAGPRGRYPAAGDFFF